MTFTIRIEPRSPFGTDKGERRADAEALALEIARLGGVEKTDCFETVQKASVFEVSVLLTPSGGWRQDLGRVEGARERRHRSQNSAETPEPRRDCRVGAGV
jgi:hypothetical protein